TLADGLHLSCDVVVVGSGAGGAAAAAALAESGLRVIVLEEGGAFEPGKQGPSVADAFRKLYVEKANRVMTGSGFMPLPGGRGLGGSTVINSAICFRAAPRIFARWRDEFGIDGLSDREVDAYYQEVETTLAVGITRPEIGRKHNEAFARGARALNLAGGWMPRNAPGCVGCGVCELGCPSGGKNSADRTFLPRALNHGADVLTGCRVARLTGHSTRVTGVTGEIHDPETRRPLGSFRVTADRVVLSAGSVATPILLQAHGLGGQHVGRHLSVHPGGWAAGVFDEVIDFWNGVPQGYYATLEPAAGVILETFTVAPGLGVAQFSGFGKEMAGWLPKLRHLAFCGAMVEDSESEGTVRAGMSGGAAVRYKMAPADVAKLKRGIFEIVRTYEASGAPEFVVGLASPVTVKSSNDAKAALDKHFQPTDFRLYASHPMGTCRMGPDRAKAVVDNDGQVHGTRGLYVADASLFPTPLGVNPQMTVMLMALRVARRIAAS
ncbi:MAG: GMC family oxidoreductase, partial [Candidatus Sericytochromatia bacterium]|nr:GMC family oxidoreductase [Candidatus Tanganyikabacteria bacterium]